MELKHLLKWNKWKTDLVQKNMFYNILYRVGIKLVKGFRRSLSQRHEIKVRIINIVAICDLKFLFYFFKSSYGL